MTYLCIIFASPLYFAIRKNWGAFTLNAILYGFACLLVATIIGIAVAPIFWALAVGHAGWHLRTELMTQQVELIASKMAEKFRQAVHRHCDRLNIALTAVLQCIEPGRFCEGPRQRIRFRC